jgi:SAM-dependent methyltransferase
MPASGPVSFFESYSRMTTGEKNAHWDGEYRQGKWRFLDSVDEMPRHAISAGLISQFRSPDVLDVGCGTGALLRFLVRFNAYVGIDVSSESIKRATALQVPNATFQVTDLEDLVLTAQFDAIVFSESLYYALEPKDALLRMGRSLKPRGFFVISMWAPPEEPEFDEYRIRSQDIWSVIDQEFTVVHDIGARTINHRWDKGQTRPIDYRIKAIRPKA